MIRWFLYPVGGDNYLVVAAVALALLAVWALVPLPGRTTLMRRRALLGLRLTVIALVILAMLRPTLVLTETKKQSATLVFLLDKSRSMSVADETGDRTRWETLKRTLDEARDAIRELGADFEIKAYTFDAELSPTDVSDGRIALGSAPDGEQSAIGAAMDQALRQEAGKRLLGVFLLSDGAQRAYAPHDALPQTAAAKLGQLGYPLFTLRFGDPRGAGQTQDAAVTDLLADPTVFVKNELRVNAQVRINGYANKRLPLKLLAEDASGEMKVVAQKTVETPQASEQIPVEFTYVPEESGEFKLSVEIDGQPGEVDTTNNRLSTFVRVLKGGLQVLYVEGSLRAEKPYLVRSLAASPDVKVDDIWLNPLAKNPPGNRADWFVPGKYDVYILGDVDSSTFELKELTALAEAVSKGAGLIMLGGFHSFGPGGYSETPLADVLPVRMDRLERQPPGSPPNRNLHVPGPVKMQPTERGLNHSAMRLGGSPQESRNLWTQLPPMEGANRFDLNNVKPGALVLAETDQNRPLLISQQYGEGRVMAFAGDSTWHWWMQGFQNAHKRFWRQTVLWLAKKDETSEGNVWIKLAQRRFAPGQPVEFTVGAVDANGERVKNASFRAEVELPDGTKQPIPIVARDEDGQGSFRGTVKAGDYRVRVTATAEGAELGSAQSRFLVPEEDLELSNPVADGGLLQSLAAMTGGQAAVPEELGSLLRQLAAQSEKFDVKTEVKRTFWDTWPFFIALVCLLGAEWYLRKRWGMV